MTRAQIASRIKQRRQVLQFRTGVHSQQFIANKLNLERSTYTHMELGNTPISAELLTQIADVLSCSAAEFVSPSAPSAVPETREADNGEELVVAFYRGLPGVDRRQAQDYLEYLHMKHVANAPAEDEGEDEPG